MKDSNFLVDTSVIVYAYDDTDSKKQQEAANLLNTVFEGDAEGIVSNQILAETFNVLTTQMRVRLGVEEGLSLINDFLASAKWVKINYSADTVRNAIVTSKAAKAPFWDALIAETMKANGITTIVTENTKDFEKIPGIRAVNPFK